MDPFIDFSKLENPPEGVDPAALNSEAVQNYVKSAFDANYEKRFETDASGLKANVETIKAEKQKLQGYLDAFKDVDLDEYNQAIEFKKSNGDASKLLDAANEKNQILAAELNGKDEAFQSKLEEKDTALTERDEKIRSMLLTNNVNEGISNHNAKFPAVALKPAQEKWIAQEASNVWKFNPETEKFLPMNGERVMTGPSGDVLTYSEWINSLRDMPDFKEFFQQPQGGGAGGGTNTGGQHYNPKNLAGTKDERASAIGGMFPNLPAR